MAGDYSRDTFDASKHYSGVREQQGRVRTDADANEQLAIQRHRTETETRDVVGMDAMPKAAAGFGVDVTADGSDLTLSPGRAYVGGQLCQLEATAVAGRVVSAAQRRIAVAAGEVDGRPWALGQWLEITAAGHGAAVVTRIVDLGAIDTSTAGVTATVSALGSFQDATTLRVRRVTTYATQPDLPLPAFIRATASPPTGPGTLDLADGDYLAYLDAWQREITALDDPRIREVALGGPDTTTRQQSVWQVRLLALPPGSPPASPPASLPSCGDTLAAWDTRTASPSGRLNARTVAAPPSTSPCELPPTAGFRRLENQLYRVQVHTGGPRADATFKWSRDNATVVSAIESIAGATVVVTELGKDEILSFAVGDWVEVVDDQSVLMATPNDLVRITAIDPAAREITVGTSLSGLAGRAGLQLVRWNQRGNTAGSAGVATPSGWVGLEDGVEVRFSKGSYRAGDHWLIPARTATGEIEWPPYAIPNRAPLAQAPAGIEHSYSRLALLRVVGGAVTDLRDCRKPFPALSEICAEDVCFDDTVCGSDVAGASNVQQAIDALCRSRKDGCSLVMLPVEGWQQALEQIATGQDAHICFQTGTYVLDTTYTFSGKGHLKLTGCGPGTRIVAASAEAALRFERCASVTVRDLHVETGVVGIQKRGEANGRKGLNGSLTFCACPRVDLDNVSLKCGAGSHRAGTCVTVTDSCDPPATGTRTVVPVTARIRRSTFAIGHLQVGILLVNVARARVVDNELRVVKKPRRMTLATMVQDKELRAAVRKTLVRNPTLEAETETSGRSVATVRWGGRTVRFETERSLVGEWENVVRTLPPRGFLNSNRELWRHIQGIANQAILNAGRIDDVRVFQPWYRGIASSNPAVASQAIVVGGRVARDVQIQDNTIFGTLQGIRVGVSHRETSPGAPDLAGAVSISGNHIEVLLPRVKAIERFGVFVGNCDSLMIENNFLKLRRLASADDFVTGTRIWGHLGMRMIVRHNHLTGFDRGVEVKPLPFGTDRQHLWLVADNVASVSAPSVVRQTNNVSPPA